MRRILKSRGHSPQNKNCRRKSQPGGDVRDDRFESRCGVAGAGQISYDTREESNRSNLSSDQRVHGCRSCETDSRRQCSSSDQQAKPAKCERNCDVGRQEAVKPDEASKPEGKTAIHEDDQCSHSAAKVIRAQMAPSSVKTDKR